MRFNPNNLECHLILPDIHIPYHDKHAIQAIHHYIEWRNKTKGVLPVSGITQLGDFIESEAVSRHNEGIRGLQEGKRLKAEYDEGHRILLKWREMLGPKGQITLIEGNHEYRVQAYLEKNPELQGLISVPQMLKLDELGVKWVENWTDKANLHKIGKAYFGHGFKTNEYHAGSHAKYYHGNFFYGHTHAVQTYSLALIAKGKVVEAVSCGWLGDRKKSKWMKGQPDKWENAFVIFYVDKQSGIYQYNIVRVFDGFFMTEGVVFGPRGMVK